MKERAASEAPSEAKPSGVIELETRRGIKCRVREAGAGAPLVFLHGAGGLLPDEPLLAKLAERFHVLAPVWPGFGEDAGEERLEDMLDFTLHGWDVVEALGLERPHLVGHSMGGMIAAEMACVNNAGLGKLALLAPVGLWLDAHPIPDLFATPPWELPGLLFFDPAAGQKALLAGLDFGNDAALTRFMVENARRLGTAGKILFPIPNRRLSKRLYRLRADTLLVWGREDKLIPPVYASRWQELVPRARLAWIERAGHMLHLEQPGGVAEAIAGFLG
jgi:pimeloyl-ACP methyl ester carboxylesterase